MKLTLGENIRNLRREKDITQEELAGILGVSYQSVSRWEKGVCYPDMELLPDIADFFGIGVDKLMGVDKSIEEKDVEEYLFCCKNALNRGLVYECIDIARKGVREYPNNYILLNKLMEALFISGDSSGNIPEWEDNMKKNDAEIISLGERIMKYCPDHNIRLEATARLAFHHHLMGRKELARKICEELPSAKNCKENNIWWYLEDDEIEVFTRRKIKSDYESLKSYIWFLATSNCRPEDEQINIINKVFELEELITDGNIIKNSWGHARLNYELACSYMNTDNKEGALNQIKLCLNHAKMFDERSEEQTYSSLLLGKVIERRSDFETTDTRPLLQIVREDWLRDEELSALTDSKEFIEMINEF